MFYHPDLVRIIEAEDLDMETKLQRLVKATVRGLDCNGG
jgi:hypothetical protein